MPDDAPSAPSTGMANSGSSSGPSITIRNTSTDHLKFHPYHEVFDKLKIGGDNYLTWRRDVRQYANVRKLAHTLSTDTNLPAQLTGTPQEKAFMLAILRAHMDEGLKDLYDDEDQPGQVWTKLEAKFALTIMAQKARVRKEWQDLGIDRCTSLDDYETKANALVKKMRLCGYAEDVKEAELIHKTAETLTYEPLRTTFRAKGIKSFDTLMFELREHEVRDEVARDRTKALTRTDAVETHATVTRHGPRDHDARPPTHQRKHHPYRKDAKGKAKAPKKPMTIGPNTLCFACGKKGHIGRQCGASDREKLEYLHKKFVETRNSDKDRPQVNNVEIAFGGQGGIMFGEVHCTMVEENPTAALYVGPNTSVFYNSEI